MKTPRIDLDDVLDKFSLSGRYHLLFMIVSVYAYASCGLLYTTYIFVVEDSAYRCVDEAFINNTCEIVAGERCKHWTYDNPNSFTAEFNLACQDWKRTSVGSAHGFGSMVGLILVGPLSDRIGRKKATIVAGMSAATLGLVQSFSPSYWFYVIMEFLAAAFGNFYSPLYILNLEIVSSKKRALYQLLCGLGYIPGAVLFATAAWGISYWRNLLRAINIPVFLLISICLVDESPRWLLTEGKKEKTIAVLQRMGNMNKVVLKKEDLDNLFVGDDKNKGIAFVQLLKLTFQSWTLLKRWLVTIVWWITCTFVHNGSMVYSTVSLQGNKYINYALLEALDLPGNIITIYILKKFKRKIPFICTFFAAGVLFFVYPILTNDLPLLSVLIFMISKLITSVSFSITSIYTSELFPTYTRNSVQSLSSSVGRIGDIIAPQTPLLLMYWSGLPSLLFGAMSLCAGLVTFFVPDTANDALPDTIQEAERLGNNKNADITGIDNLGMISEQS